MVDGERGQAHTLEGVMAAVLLLGSLVFALQVTAVTPLSASTSSQHIENQEQATAAGVLASGVDDGSLKRNLLYCYQENRAPAFYGANQHPYYVAAPSTEGSESTTGFGEKLKRTFAERSIAYNVYLTYETDPTGSGEIVRERFVYQGSPSDNAVAATRSVVLFEDDEITEESGSDGDLTGSTGQTVSDAGCYGDGSDASGVYRVVEVEVVVWRQ